MSLSSYFCTLDVCFSSNGAMSETMVTSQTMDWSFSYATRSGILSSVVIIGSTLVMSFLVSFFSNRRTRLLCHSHLAASIPVQTLEASWNDHPLSNHYFLSLWKRTEVPNVKIDRIIKLSIVSCFSCFMAAGPFDFPNILYSQRIALLSFKASSFERETHPHWTWNCHKYINYIDILLILMIGTHFLSCSNPSPPALTPA